jgi:hypothetical protein
MRYEGLVHISGSLEAWVTVDDVDAIEWVGSIGEFPNISPRSGLHTIRLGEGDHAGAFAVVEVEYDDKRGRGTLAGRTPFGPDPQPLSGGSTP